MIAAEVPSPPARISVIFSALLGRASADSIRGRLLFALRRLLSMGRLQPPENGAAIRRIREFKGVPNSD